jgi:protein ImuB
MSRIVSVWLPRWPVLRFLAAQTRLPVHEPIDAGRPFILAGDASGGRRVAALNAAAERLGLAIGDPVADARAKAGDELQVRSAEPAADHAALRRLALWATRYTPSVSLWGESSGADGFFLDVTGSAHLFDGEEGLLADLARRLKHFGLPPRLAAADTAGAAWALSHFHSSAAVVLPTGRQAEALAPLPMGALRLSDDTRTTLRRLGFKRVGALLDKPRAPFAARFPAELLHRLDQALGHASEPLKFIVPPPAYHARRQLLEPIATQEAIVAVALHLMEDLAAPLMRDGMGARALRLALYRVDGEVATVDLGFTLPTRSPAHVARLLGLKLERLIETIDAGFGYEALGLAVTVAERLQPRQGELSPAADGADRAEHCAALIDSLRQRLGPRSVRRLQARASHLPERAEGACAAADQAQVWPAPDAARQRPILLLPQAEPAEVVTPVPDGPPRRFRWRGMNHDVAHMQGPERIASEWWRDSTRQPTRDYYVVEDEAGRRFWLYREGIQGREMDAAPRWFVHGLFA